MNPPHAERGGLPIREVTRLTGVHPVTLRAWERRYGLVVPQRTGKGHRLYSEEQVERIRRILVWLERGVAISQVRALLERPEETPAADVESPGKACTNSCWKPSPHWPSAVSTICSTRPPRSIR